MIVCINPGGSSIDLFQLLGVVLELNNLKCWAYKCVVRVWCTFVGFSDNI